MAEQLLSVFGRFHETLTAVTIPTDGGRVIPDHSGALALSEMADELYLAMANERERRSAPYEKPVSQLPTYIKVEHSDSPDGPWKSVPNEQLRKSAATIGRNGVNAVLVTALNRAMRVVGFSAKRWNELQARKPGGNHRRYRRGDFISDADLEQLASVERLLRLVPTEPDDAETVEQYEYVKLINLTPPSHVPISAASEHPREQLDLRAFRRSGRVWQLTFEGRNVSIPHKDATGLAYIQQALIKPGCELEVAALLAAVSGNQRVKVEGAGDDVLDAEAREHYRERLQGLRQDLEGAKDKYDVDGQERIQSEIEQLTEQLRLSSGLGGRSRKLGDQSERIRSQVSMAIKRAFDVLDQEHPALAKHLRKSISTGRTVKYDPEHPVPWTF